MVSSLSNQCFALQQGHFSADPLDQELTCIMTDMLFWIQFLINHLIILFDEANI